MQNKQTSSIKYICQNIHASYRQFLTELTTAAEVEVPLLPVMPAFHRTLFLTLAQTRDYAVMLQMNPMLTQTHPYNIHGHLRTLASGQLVLINRAKHLTHLIDPDQIRYLKRV